MTALAEMKGVMKQISDLSVAIQGHHTLQEHLSDIKKEKEAESSVRPFCIDNFSARLESEDFLMSVEANLSSIAPSLKPIR